MIKNKIKYLIIGVFLFGGSAFAALQLNWSEVTDKIIYQNAGDYITRGSFSNLNITKTENKSGYFVIEGNNIGRFNAISRNLERINTTSISSIGNILGENNNCIFYTTNSNLIVCYNKNNGTNETVKKSLETDMLLNISFPEQTFYLIGQKDELIFYIYGNTSPNYLGEFDIENNTIKLMSETEYQQNIDFANGNNGKFSNFGTNNLYRFRRTTGRLRVDVYKTDGTTQSFTFTSTIGDTCSGTTNGSIGRFLLGRDGNCFWKDDNGILEESDLVKTTNYIQNGKVEIFDGLGNYYFDGSGNLIYYELDLTTGQTINRTTELPAGLQTITSINYNMGADGNNIIFSQPSALDYTL